MSDLEFRTVGLGADAVDYRAAWDLQREVHARVADGEATPTVLLLEHPPVYTAGKRTLPHERPVDSGGAPVIEVDRGGKITFHGPGQLVGYPIVPLPDHVKVVDYVRRVEEALIQVCADVGVTHRPGPRPQRRVAACRQSRSRAQGRRARHPGQPRGHHARLRAQLRRRPCVVRTLRPLRHRRRRRHHAQRRSSAAGSRWRRCCRRYDSTSRTTWPGRRTPRRRTTTLGPDPAKQPRIELVTPSR